MIDIPSSTITYGEKEVGALEKEIQKAHETRNQRILWNSVVGLRIALQTPVDISNKLPRAENYEEFLSVARNASNTVEKNNTWEGPDVSSALASTSAELSSILSDFRNFQVELLRRNKNLASMVVAPSSSLYTNLDDLEGLWSEIHLQQSKLYAYEKEMIEKWHVKLSYASGNQSTKFISFNKSAISQVERMLQEDRTKQKLFERSQIVPDGHVIFGHFLKNQKEKKEERDGENEGSDDDDSVPLLGHQKTKMHLLDAHIYNDNDFFDFLVREYLQTGALHVDDPVGTSQQYLKVRRLIQRKKKRNVERGASKGRKLRYQVHQKLTGFMNSQDLYPSRDSPFSKALFSNLLGVDSKK
eukprot:TRINITY_DN6978_c0_g1_i1.p1 TRINITY_DN6978_c0_g1~~TRINITY_DN6978_c0_g1_i1.p1  ORF type:complete len:357 (-),score=86.70 TRINITY_DN6978_c0_g1_i1:53-1123(-)